MNDTTPDEAITLDRLAAALALCQVRWATDFSTPNGCEAFLRARGVDVDQALGLPSPVEPEILTSPWPPYVPP